MSVINQMLRDLEQRKVQESISNHYIDEVNIVAKSKVNIWWFILPIIILVTIGTNLYLHSLNSKKVPQPGSEQAIKIDKKIPILLPTKLSEIQSNSENTKKALSNDALSNKKSRKVELSSTEQIEEKVTEPKIKPDVKVVMIENKDRESLYNQPSVKTETFLKPDLAPKMEVEKKSQSGVKKVQVKVKHVNKAEVKKTSVKTTAVVNTGTSKKKASVKSTQKKITAEQVIAQASEVMEADQLAAILLLKKNLNKVKPDADYYSLLANLQQRQHKYDDAISSYRKALKIAPQKGDLWIGVALAYRGTGENENAIKAFRQALSSNEITPQLRRYASQQIGSQ